MNEQETFLRQVLAIHSEVIESLEWRGIAGDVFCLEDPQVRDCLFEIIKQYCDNKLPEADEADKERMVAAVVAETVGLGPIDFLLHDDQISDILVNHWNEVFIERSGQLIRTGVRFLDDAHVLRIVQRVAARIGRRIDEGAPVVDARLPDGSRVHAMVPPLAVRGPTLSIRRFASRPLGLEQLVKSGSMSAAMAALLSAAVQGRVSCLISGGTGAGKTTLLNALSAHIPHDERLVTIEDVSELRLSHPHIVSLEARNANVEGKGEVSIRELVRNSLRMRPDRIIVGEVRGPEAIDMLQALNTGHEGSLTTIHANDTRDALSRLELMVGMAGQELPHAILRQYIAAGVGLLIHMARLKGGVRRILGVAELVGVENSHYRVEDVFGFRQTDLDQSGRARGYFYATGYIPRCLERLRATGLQLGDELFQQTTVACAVG